MRLEGLLTAIYAGLLRAFPRGHRDRYRQEMVDAFARELVARRDGSGAAAALRFALRSYLDAVLAGASERRRALRSGSGGGGFGADLLYAVRSLARSWTYALVCLLSLAAGLGVTAAVMLLYRVTMEAPFELDQAGLVEVLPTEPEGEAGNKWSYPDFVDLAAAVRSADLTAWAVSEGSLRPEGADAGERVEVGYVSAGYFEALRIEPALGRFHGASDGAPSDEIPVVVAHAFWTGTLAGDPGVVGRVLVLNRTPHVVVGVAPQFFRHHDTRQRADVWVPLESHPELAIEGELRHDRSNAWLGILGRVGPGSSLPQVEMAAASLVAGLAAAHPATHAERGVRILPWHWQGAYAIADDGWIMGAVFFTLCGFLVLVVCLNLAGMAMVRSASRERELALRLAIGSTRRRLVQVLMAESLVVAAVGGALVIAVVWVALRTISWRIGVPLPANAEMDAPLIAACMAAALATSLVFGLIPALRFSRPDLLAAMKDDSGTGGRRSGLLHRIVAAAQAGLAVPVLVVAVTVAQGALEIGQVDFGVREEGLVVWMPANLVPDGYDAESTQRFGRDLAREIEGLPGVERVAIADGMPLDGQPRPATVSTPEMESPEPVRITRVGPGYLEALGVPLLRGRPIGEEDGLGAEPVAVVTASLADSLYDGASALGRRLTLDTSGGEGEGRSVTIIGVAADFVGQWLGPSDQVLVSLAQEPSAVLSLAVLADPAPGAAEALVPGIERVALELDRELAQPNVATFVTVVETAAAEFPIWGAFFGLLAGLLLLLSALGIYGVVAFTFASRRREIGVRMSLGSSQGSVLLMVLRDGVRLAAPGLVLGAAAGTAVSALVLNPMFVGTGLPLAGVGTLAAAGLASLAAVLLASLLPARRAASVDPLEAFRSG